MKMRMLITGLVLLTLVRGTGAFGAPLAAPVLSVTTSRIMVTVSWTEVEGAEGYLFYYAPYPGGIPIGQLDVGLQTGPFVFELWPEAAFYVAAQAYDSQGGGDLSGIVFFQLPLVPLHRSDVSPECLEGCYQTCVGEGRTSWECLVECEYQCGTRPYVIIDKTFYSHVVSPSSDALYDARARIYLLLEPTGVEDAFTIDHADLHSAYLHAVTKQQSNEYRCSGSSGSLISPAGSILRVNADRQTGTVDSAVIPSVGVTINKVCDGQSQPDGLLGFVELMTLIAMGAQRTETVSSGQDMIGEQWELILPASGGETRVTYRWVLYTPQ